MITNLRLPLNFDPRTLQADLLTIPSEAWIAHFNTGYYDGDWSGIALRALDGDPTRLYPDPHSEETIRDTVILERCPFIGKVLAAFLCPIRSARLLRLAPDSEIKEHRDYNLALEDGEIRLHIPILTHSNIEFFLDGRRIDMREGECWYLNFNLAHRVRNPGPTDRVHLVIDCVVNDWLRDLLNGQSSSGIQNNPEPLVVQSPASAFEFERFREHILQNPQLHRSLRETTDREIFARLVTETGQDLGFHFTAEDVHSAWREARREWLSRWVE